MSSVASYPHISTSEDGKVRIECTRYKVAHLAAEHYHYGWSAEELLRQHSDLRPEEVYAALTYFYDHFEAMVTEMESVADRLDSHREKHRLSRTELLRCGQENR